MTDESHSPGTGDQSPDVSPAGDATGDFSSGEGMVALAGMILLGVWLIFDVFLDDFGLASIELLLAVTAVAVPRMNRESVEKVNTVPMIMKVTGYAIAIVGAFFIIEAIEEGFYDSALTIIAALVSYAAYAVAFLGARSIKS